MMQLFKEYFSWHSRCVRIMDIYMMGIFSGCSEVSLCLVFS